MDQHQALVIQELARLTPTLRIYTKSNPEFEHYRVSYNRALGDQPLAIVRPRTEEEVSQVVQVCSAEHIPLAIRSGGHDFFGRSLVADGIVIDMRAMDSILISPDRASARVGGGVIAGTLQQSLAAHQLFTPTGQSKTVGYVSWACGGGYGFYVGTYGFGVDQILGARVAVASGAIIDTDDDQELLWALRGAGAGNFGVIVELRVRVYPAPKLYAGYLAFPLSSAVTVLEGFEKLAAEGLPDEFSGDGIVAHPDMLQGVVSEPCFTFFWCWTAVDGDLEPAKAFLRKVMGLGTVLANTVEETTAAAYGIGDSSSPTFFCSRNIRGLNSQVGAIFSHHPPIHPLSAVVIHNNHGKGVRMETPGFSACFPSRFPHVILGFHGGTYAGVEVGSDTIAAASGWAKRLRKEIEERGLALDGGFPSFFPPKQIDVEQFFGMQAAERLRRLKGRLDPVNVFSGGMVKDL
ncbi:oxidoreductase [Aspergillus bombycis]|uniref:Oxidoreductase n=1 Tax=Aspergillus bombycis TaxID=109264 RepID=A0A1F7ZSY0_9EURO|nr:oxidoreductase [Aspergillus bombycis]OGM42544.1 oxidoreductase [Aspergillus bombycis]